MKKQHLLGKIKNLIATDKIEAALQLLTEAYANNAQFDQIIQQSGRYHALKKAQQQGTIDFAEAQKALNSLRQNILDFLKENPEISTTTVSVDKALKAEYQLAFARIQVLKVLQEVNKAETISIFYKLSKVKQRKWVVQSLNELELVGFVKKTKVGRSVFWELSSSGQKFANSFSI